MKKYLSILVCASFVVVASCAVGKPKEEPSPNTEEPQPEKKGGAMSFVFKSASFAQNGKIPAKYTCDGGDISPDLSWSDPPQGTAEFALVCDDPDAPVGIWCHWIIYNIAPETRDIPEGEKKIPGIQGRNDFGNINYGGPCPPRGKPHRYRFTLFALKTKLNLPVGVERKTLLKAIEGNVVGQAEIVGTYGR